MLKIKQKWFNLASLKLPFLKIGLMIGLLRVGRVTGRVGSGKFSRVGSGHGSANFEISTGRAGSGLPL